jgi:hypothetical protein
VLAAYLLHDAAELGALHGAWYRRFEADPALHTRFRELSAEFVAWLARA